MRSTLTAAPEPSKAADKLPAREARRRNILAYCALNARGHDIIAAAEHLRDLIDSVDDENLEGAALYALGAAGYEGDEGMDLGTLHEWQQECAGFRWALDVFIALVRPNLIPVRRKSR